MELLLAILGAAAAAFAFGWLFGRGTAPRVCPPGTWVDLDSDVDDCGAGFGR